MHFVVIRVLFSVAFLVVANAGCYFRANINDLNMLSEQSVSQSDFKVTINSNQSYINLNNQNTFPVFGDCNPSGSTVSVSVNGNVYSESAVCNSGKWSLDLNTQSHVDGIVTLQAKVSKVSFKSNSDFLSIEKDTVVPVVGFFKDMNFGSLTKSPVLEWGSVTDLDTGVNSYEVALGTAPGLTDTRDWISVADLNLTNFSFDSLVLTNGSMYFPSFRVKDKAGNVKVTSANSGFRAVNQWKDQTPYSNKNYINRSSVYFMKTFSNNKTLVYGAAGKDSGTYLGYSKLGYFDKEEVLINPLEISQIKNPEYVLKQTDGKFIINSDNWIYRFGTDFALDNSFVPYNEVDSIYHLILQADNKILYCTSTGKIIRLNTSGGIDNSFSVGSGANSLINNLELQSDGKILVGGAFTSLNGQSYNRIIRLNSDGSVDNSFVIGTGFNEQVYKIKLQADGKILVGGYFTSFNGNVRNKIVRLNSDGSLDGTFTIGSGVNGNFVFDIELQSSNKIVIAGWFTQYNGVNQAAIARLNSNGTLDGTFNVPTGCTRIYEISMQSTDKIIVNNSICATFNGNTIVDNFFRLDANGNYDNTFDVGKKISRGLSLGKDSLLVFSDDTFILNKALSWNTSSHSNLYMLDTDEKILSTFSSGTGVDLGVSSAAMQADGKIVICGSFTSYNSAGANRIARLNSNGSLDPAFVIGSGFNNKVSKIIIQPDGKILAAGLFTSYNTITYNRIIRLLSDGSVDPSFNIGTGLDGQVNDMALTSDGKIILGGVFLNYNGTAKSTLLRLNPNGSLDTTFTFDDTTITSLDFVRVNSKNEVLLGGYFYNDDFSQSFITRKIALDGSKDLLFHELPSPNSIYDLEVLTDDTFIVSQDSSSQLSKHNPDGSIDNTFIAFNFSPFSFINTISFKSNGMILFGGVIESYDGRDVGDIIKVGW